MRILCDAVPSPLGKLLLATTYAGELCALDFEEFEGRFATLLEKRFGNIVTDEGSVDHVRRRISAYFGGELEALQDIPVHTRGTVFQEQVWTALRSVKPGHTLSYSDLAESLGKPDTTRAVGAANGSNPIAIAIPCHRIVGADGRLTGYAGSLWRKQWLLEHEGAVASIGQMNLPLTPQPRP
jgi:methylated-DNA-[protein]-cysteine S-methyltransferase